jgi:hypothetical protein
LRFPASFSWKDEAGISLEYEGRTRNISEKGAFVEAANLPPIGSSVELYFSVPSISCAEGKMHVQFTGETLRVEWPEQGEHSGGFAITSHEIVWHNEGGNNLGGAEEQEN